MWGTWALQTSTLWDVLGVNDLLSSWGPGAGREPWDDTGSHEGLLALQRPEYHYSEHLGSPGPAVGGDAASAMPTRLHALSLTSLER